MKLSIFDFLVYTLGFSAQIMFFARTIVQWVKSEKAGKVLSPLLFWQISLFASIMMLVYGILRKDFAIIFGQMLVYFIYIRNIQLHGAWKKLPLYFRGIAFLMPLTCIVWVFVSGNYSFNQIVNNQEVETWLMYWGIAAQVTFAFRFVFQWISSEKKKESSLPLEFWYISLAGSAMILFYAIMRKDPVLFLGHLGSSLIYLRNLLLHYTGKGLFDLLPFDVGVVKKYIPKRKK